MLQNHSWTWLIVWNAVVGDASFNHGLDQLSGMLLFGMLPLFMDLINCLECRFGDASIIHGLD